MLSTKIKATFLSIPVTIRPINSNSTWSFTQYSITPWPTILFSHLSHCKFKGSLASLNKLHKCTILCTFNVKLGPTMLRTTNCQFRSVLFSAVAAMSLAVSDLGLIPRLHDTTGCQTGLTTAVVKVRGNAVERRSWAPKNCWRAFPGPTQRLVVRTSWEGPL